MNIATIKERTARYYGQVLHFFSGMPDRMRRNPRAGILGMTLAILVIVIVGAGIATMRSLPGGMLYSAKTAVLEEAFAGLRFTSNAKLAYRVDLIERRLHEMERLGAQEAIAEDAFSAHYHAAASDIEAFNALVESEGVPLTDVLSHMHTLASALRAQETLTEEHEQLRPAEEGIEDLRREAENLHEDIAAVFVASTDQTGVQDYIRAQLEVLMTAVNEGNLSEDLLDSTAERIADISDAVAEDDAVEAIVRTSEARQGIDVALYLSDA